MKSLDDRTIDYYQNIDQWKIWKWSLVKWIGKEEWELKKSGLFLFKHQRIVTYEMFDFLSKYLLYIILNLRILCISFHLFLIYVT